MKFGRLRLDVARLEVECRLHEREKLAFAADTEKMKQLLQQAEHVCLLTFCVSRD